MRYVMNRKYPITHMKQNAQQEERVLDLSVTAAAGLLVFVFAEGVFWGYMMKKWIS